MSAVPSIRTVVSRADFDTLINLVLPFAQRMLATHGEFHPFGAVLASEGEARLVSGVTEEDHPDSADVARRLLEALRERVGKREVRATAVSTDVRIRHPDTGVESDAIEVALEHLDDEAPNVYLPYEEGTVTALRYGGLLATAATPRAFVTT